VTSARGEGAGKRAGRAKSSDGVMDAMERVTLWLQEARNAELARNGGSPPRKLGMTDDPASICNIEDSEGRLDSPSGSVTAVALPVVVSASAEATAAAVTGGREQCDDPAQDTMMREATERTGPTSPVVMGIRNDTLMSSDKESI